MARRKKRKSAKRSRACSVVLFRKRAKCPASIKRECKTGKGGQTCRVTAGSCKGRWQSAGAAQRTALNLKARLAKAKGCSPGFATKLGRYGRR